MTSNDHEGQIILIGFNDLCDLMYPYLVYSILTLSNLKWPQIASDGLGGHIFFFVSVTSVTFLSIHFWPQMSSEVGGYLVIYFEVTK